MSTEDTTAPNPRLPFFEALSERWDAIYDAGRARPLLAAGLARHGVGPAEHVVDLGCGTGVLLGVLGEHLGPQGRIEAVDLAPAMIARAQRKFPDPRIRFHVADVCALPLADGAVDRVLCFSAWPHFPDPDAAIAELARVLRPGGRLHIWHIDSRATINHIHQTADPAVAHDLLEPAADLAARLQAAGLTVTSQQDDDQAYELVAHTPAG